MWKGVKGSLGPCGGGGIAGMAVGSHWCSWAARVYIQIHIYVLDSNKAVF